MKCLQYLRNATYKPFSLETLGLFIKIIIITVIFIVLSAALLVVLQGFIKTCFIICGNAKISTGNV